MPSSRHPPWRRDPSKPASGKPGAVQGWSGKPARLRQKDRDTGWTVKFSKAKPCEDGAPRIDLAVLAFGYKNHVSIDRWHGLIRGWTASHAAARLAEVIDRANTASDVWADTAYRSVKNETLLAERGLVSRIHHQKPRGRLMSERTRRAYARRSVVRSAVEHVLARQKGPMALVVRTIDLANLATPCGATSGSAAELYRHKVRAPNFRPWTPHTGPHSH